MDRIKIDIQAWESAMVPICTKLVNIDLAEQLLYQGMVMDYGYTDDEIMHLVNHSDDPECENPEWEKWNERLCAEEEAVIIECGGVYYEDMDPVNDPTPTVYEAVRQIKAREQQELAEVLKQYGTPTSTGCEYRFEDESPIVASYINDEPCDLVVLAVWLDGNALSIYGMEKNCGFSPRFHDPNEVFAGHLDCVTSEIVYRATKAA